MHYSSWISFLHSLILLNSTNRKLTCLLLFTGSLALKSARVGVKGSDTLFEPMFGVN